MDKDPIRTDPKRGASLPNAGLPLCVQPGLQTSSTRTCAHAGIEPGEKGRPIRERISEIMREVYGRDAPEKAATSETQLEFW